LGKKYKGTSACGRKFKAYIRVLGKYLHLGVYSDERDAAKAYDVAAMRHFKEFARLNF
jgi:hypothetical protein